MITPSQRFAFLFGSALNFAFSTHAVFAAVHTNSIYAHLIILSLALIGMIVAIDAAAEGLGAR